MLMKNHALTAGTAMPRLHDKMQDKKDMRRVHGLICREPSSILQTIYFRTVLLSVLYGILVWGSCSLALMDDLERAHIRASKLIFKRSRNSNADQLKKLKGWNNLSFYYTKRLLVEAYKSYYRSNTNVLNDLVMLKQSSHCLRKSMNIEFPSPKTEIGRLTSVSYTHLTLPTKRIV